MPAVAAVIARQFWESVQSIHAFVHLPRRYICAPPVSLIAWMPEPPVPQDSVLAAKAFRAPEKNYGCLNRYA